VDSGNLAGALMTLSAGCVSSPQESKTMAVVRGRRDTAGVLAETLAAFTRRAQPATPLRAACNLAPA
jgi:hypothetical protein